MTAPTPSAPPPAVAQQDGPVQATFSGLPQGTFPVHLHSACDGRQRFHITYLPNLVVDSSSTGTVSVPANDTGRGWCLIVYTNSAATVVLATKHV